MLEIKAKIHDEENLGLEKFRVLTAQTLNLNDQQIVMAVDRGESKKHGRFAWFQTRLVAVADECLIEAMTNMGIMGGYLAVDSLHGFLTKQKVTDNLVGIAENISQGLLDANSQPTKYHAYNLQIKDGVWHVGDGLKGMINLNENSDEVREFLESITDLRFYQIEEMEETTESETEMLLATNLCAKDFKDLMNGGLCEDTEDRRKRL